MSQGNIPSAHRRVDTPLRDAAVGTRFALGCWFALRPQSEDGENDSAQSAEHGHGPSAKVPEREKGEVLVAFKAQKKDVTAGSAVRARAY